MLTAVCIGRLRIVRYYLGKVKNDLTEEEVQALNENMNGFTGADVFSSLRKGILKGLKAL